MMVEGLSFTARLRALWQVAAPALGLGLIYWIGLHQPWSVQLAEVKKQLIRQNADNQSSGSQLPLQQQLVDARRRETELQQQLKSLELATAQLTGRSHGPSTTSALVHLADAISLLQRHGMICIETAPESSAAEPITSVSDPLRKSDRSRQRIELRLLGSFQQMRDALHELQGSPTCISLVSLTMEPGQPYDQSTHKWILIILV